MTVGNSSTAGGNTIIYGSCSIGLTTQDYPLFEVTSDGDVNMRGGNLTIMATNGVSQCEIIASNGNIETEGTIDASGTINGGSTATFAGLVSGHSFAATSDKRLKCNIEEIPAEEALDMCAKLKGYTYNWINNAKYGDEKQIGFIAQEAREVHASLVHEDENAMLRVDYDKTTAILTTAVTELWKEICALRLEIKELKK